MECQDSYASQFVVTFIAFRRPAISLGVSLLALRPDHLQNSYRQVKDLDCNRPPLHYPMVWQHYSC